MREAAIVSTPRTGIGRAYRGAFDDTEAPVLSGHVVRAAVKRAGIDSKRIDDIFLGVGAQSRTQSCNLGRLTAATAALGHSFAMTGSRLVGHALVEGRRRGVRYVVVSMCIADGMGAAGLFEIV